MGIDLPEPDCPANDVRLEVVNDFETLRNHADAWNRLTVEAGQRPELSYAWMSAHLETRLTPGYSWFCLLAYDGLRLVGVLPVVTISRRWFGGLCRCLRFEVPFDVSSTGAVEPLFRHGYEDRVFSLFIGYLWSIPCACCCLKFRELPCTRLPGVLRLRSRRRIRPLVSTGGNESFIPVQGTSDEYFGGLSRKFVHEYRRKQRRIQEQPEVRFRFESGHAEVNADVFMDIEHQGWKAQRETSIRSDESYVNFFRLLTKRLEKQGWLRWAFLDIDGKTVAGQFMVQNGSTLYVVKIGYNEDFSKLSPGVVLFGKVIENAFESDSGIRELNFMSGFPWLNDWGVQLRTLSDVTFFPAGLRRLGICRRPLQSLELLRRNPVVRRWTQGFLTRLA
jgi:hypothetical protein